jgi:DNA-binding transcriptional regulator YiaG
MDQAEESAYPISKKSIDIKGIRLVLGFTQEYLARKLELALSTVSK